MAADLSRPVWRFYFLTKPSQTCCGTVTAPCGRSGCCSESLSISHDPNMQNQTLNTSALFPPTQIFFYPSGGHEGESSYLRKDLTLGSRTFPLPVGKAVLVLSAMSSASLPRITLLLAICKVKLQDAAQCCKVYQGLLNKGAQEGTFFLPVPTFPCSHLFLSLPACLILPDLCSDTRRAAPKRPLFSFLVSTIWLKFQSNNK